MPSSQGTKRKERNVLRKFLVLKLELPCEDTRRQKRDRRKGRHQQVVVGCVLQARSLRPVINEIEGHCSNKQRDRKMDEHYVLRVFCEQNRLRIKWIQPNPQERERHVDDLKEVKPVHSGNIPVA
jgi:hypothetical protein